ncbi:MAG: ATP-binding protein [Desulfoprunum sp.]|nr:ATP-binding protein [Desulfoprunum sp.]
MKVRLANVSPWILAAACSLLAIIIGVFATTNYRREKQLMTEVLLQKGITIIRFVNAASRAKFRENNHSFEDAGWRWTEYVQQVIEQTAEQPGIHFVLFADRQGNVLAGSENKNIGGKLPPQTTAFLKELEGQPPGNAIFRFNLLDGDDRDGFQVAAIYAPLSPRDAMERMPMHQGWGMPMMGQRRGLQQGSQKWRDELERLQAEKYILLVELDPEQLNTAVKRQLLQIIILSVVLLLVGIGGWLSLLTLQGYKGSQTRLRRMRAFTDLLVSSLPVGLVATDNAGNIQIFNLVAEEILGITESQAVGCDPATVLPAQLVEIIGQSATRGKGPYRHELSLRGAEGRIRSLLLAALSIVDSEDRHVGTMLLIQDVSEVKKLEEELKRSERLAALGEMAAGVAHELRNPLSSIKGLAVLLKSRFADTSPDREAADILVREVERLNRSISELLDYARPGGLEKKKISLSEVLQKAISLIRVDTDAAGVSISTAFTAEPDFVHADQDKLNGVFLNLFLNALQAMQEGGELNIATSLEEKSVVCLVEDTGCGIDARLLARVFDPYVTSKSDGTGLGLAMSAKIIEEHEGKIEIKSVSGHGTTVKVSLPQWRAVP